MVYRLNEEQLRKGIDHLRRGIEDFFIMRYQLTSDEAQKKGIEKLIGKEKIARGLRK